MLVLYSISTKNVRLYPREDDLPVVGLDTDQYAVLLVQENPPPLLGNNQEAKRIETVEITNPAGPVNGVLTVGWEILDLPPVGPEPNWVAFGARLAFNPGVKDLLSFALQNQPAVGLGLAVGLGKADEGKTQAFLGYWNAARQSGMIDPELIAQVVEIAGECFIPLDFIEALSAIPVNDQFSVDAATSDTSPT